MLVVGPAPEGDVLDRGGSAPRMGPNVMELEERALRATLHRRGADRAPAAVPRPDRPLDRAWDVAGRGRWRPEIIRSRTDGRRASGVGRRPDLLPLDGLEEQLQGTVDYSGRIPARDLPPKESLEP